MLRRYDDAIASGWKWQARRSEGTVIDCASTFDTLADCVADAQRHGFSQLPDFINPAQGLVMAPGVYTVEITEWE